YAERLETGRLPVVGEEQLSDRQLLEEEVFLGLRSDGIDAAEIRTRYRKDLLKDYSPVIQHLLSEGLATIDRQKIRLTAKGYAVCDEICYGFLE
ncbi:MAG: hypothetical protein HYW57_00365, partial [Ignavibacteriales bacterium]|nr:hypothetical protein [Ignavibacteriales bacterium]